MVSPSDVEIVRLAAAHYRYEAHRLQAARDEHGLGAAQFWQAVARAIEDPDVAVAEPMIVARLRRQRDARMRLKRAG